MDDPRRLINIAKDFQKCLKQLPKLTDNQVRLEDWDQDALTYIDIVIEPNDGLYKDGTFKFKIELKETYPQKAPLVKSMSPIYHPNIDFDISYYTGHPTASSVCLSLFSHWTSEYGLEDVIQGMLFLFYNPNLDDPITDTFHNEPPEGMYNLADDDVTSDVIFRDELAGVFRGEKPARMDDDDTIVFKPMDELKSTEEEIQKSRVLLEQSDTFVNKLTQKALEVEKEMQKRRWRIASLKKAKTVAYYPSPQIKNVVDVGLNVADVREWFHEKRLIAEQRKAVPSDFAQFQAETDNKLHAQPTNQQHKFNVGPTQLSDVAVTNYISTSSTEKDSVVINTKQAEITNETIQTTQPHPALSDQIADQQKTSDNINSLNVNIGHEEPMDTETTIGCETAESTSCSPSTPPEVTNSSFDFSCTVVKPVLRRCATFANPSQVDICSKQALQEWRMTLS